MKGMGNFRLDFLAYDLVGVDLRTKSSATLSTLELPPKIISPFLVMILLSLVTRRNSKKALDGYYTKMKTPVDPNHEQDLKNLAEAAANPAALEKRKIFPGTDFEFQRPTKTDVIGFIICVLVCFAVIGLAIWIANIGA